MNAIAIKKFVAEKLYPDDIRAFLFRDRDGRSLQVLWKDKGRQDVSLPLPGVKDVEVIRVDGSHRTLHAGSRAITLSITEDPLLLLYDEGENLLPSELKSSTASLDTPLKSVSRGSPISLTVSLQSEPPQSVDLVAPPFWTVKKSPSQPDKNGPPAIHFNVSPPASTAVREVDLVIKLTNAQGQRQGELSHRILISE